VVSIDSVVVQNTVVTFSIIVVGVSVVGTLVVTTLVVGATVVDTTVERMVVDVDEYTRVLWRVLVVLIAVVTVVTSVMVVACCVLVFKLGHGGIAQGMSCPYTVVSICQTASQVITLIIFFPIELIAY